MAVKVKIIEYDPFYRGDTPVFGFTFSAPSNGFNWATITVDAAITSVGAPADNTGATVLRLDQPLTVDANNVASFEMQPTVLESKALVPGSEYKVQVQLRDIGGANVATAVTGKVKILQEYVI